MYIIIIIKPGVGQNMALSVSRTAREFSFSKFCLQVHSISFSTDGGQPTYELIRWHVANSETHFHQWLDD